MAASLDDILTTQKNGVIAINGINQYMRSIFSFMRGLPLSSGAATTSTSTLYTVPANTQMMITDIDICNTSASATTFTIYFVPSGGTAGTNNAIFYNAPINGHTTVQWTGTEVLAAGGTVQASAGTTTVAFTVSGGPG